MSDQDRYLVLGMWLGLIAEVDDNNGLWVVAGLFFVLSFLEGLETTWRKRK